MKSNLLNAITTNDAYTENGALTHSTSGKNCVDFFFQIGAMRGADENRLIKNFAQAYGENKLDALKVLFWSRDVLQGAGERRSFRVILRDLANREPDVVRKNLHLVSVLGRWDDLLEFVGTPIETDALNVIKNGLENKNGLTAKWMPRKGSNAALLRKHLGLTPKQYRKLLVGLSNTVEQKMCANEWSSIQYKTVPSIAMKNYHKAFYKHDLDGMKNFMQKVEKGEETINSKALYPHEIAKHFLYAKNPHNSDVLEAQWKALPNFMEKNEKRILPIVDTSGSMYGLPIEVSISLGIYISERNKGLFENAFITFSEKPTLQYLQGSLANRVHSLEKTNWGYNTNLQAVFNLILKKAVVNNVSEDEMPTTLLILSDMEFDYAVSDTINHDIIKEKYAQHGYKLPEIVFWNIEARHDNNIPIKSNQQGVALVSGFSPSILTSLLSGDLEPEKVMRKMIDKDRYKEIAV